ncbi:MAG: helix-turn-helix domain-containing protein [Bacteroidales bacterium]
MKYNPDLANIGRQKIGEFVKMARKGRGLGYMKVAEIAGIEKSIVLKIERGENYTINSLLAVLGVLRCQIFFEVSDQDHIPGIGNAPSN